MLPLLGLVMAMAILSGVFSVDMGLVYDGREQARMAADMAALAGVQELPLSEAAAVNKAQEYAALNGYDDCTDGYVGVGACDPAITLTVSAGSGYSGDPIACSRPGYCISVEVERDWQWLFGGLIGLPPVTIKASSVAQLGAQPRDIMVVLDRSGSMCDEAGQGCAQASKSALVGLDMTNGSGSISSLTTTLPNLNANSNLVVQFNPLAVGTSYSFTINGRAFTYSSASTLTSIINAINDPAAVAVTGVTASMNTGNTPRLTLTRTLFGVAPSILIDDVEPGNFFRATRMLGDPQPTNLHGNDVDSAQNTIAYPADLSVPLMNLNSASANIDVDFVAAPAGQFCIKASNHTVDPVEGDPCAAGNPGSVVVNYNPAVDSMTAVLSRINSNPTATGVCAIFVSDVLTLTRGTMSGSVCNVALGPTPITVADITGNFFQAMKFLQVPTQAYAVATDVANCSGPAPANIDTCFDTPDFGVVLPQLNDELEVDLVPVPGTAFNVGHVTGSGEFVINGCPAIPYANNDTLNTIAARIGTATAACGQGMIATVEPGSDRLVLTRTGFGDLPITYHDVVTNNGTGNFLQSMKFIAQVRRTSIVGLDVEGSVGSGFDTADLTVPLNDLAGELQVDFELGANLQFCINSSGTVCDGTPGNGVLITYTAATSGGSTLQTILDDINNPQRAGGPTGVIASIDTGLVDRLTMRRNAYGATTMSVADISGNFLHAMQLLGGSYSRVTGLRVSECNNCDVDGNELSNDMEDIDSDLLFDIASVSNGQFEINGQPIFYNSTNESINDVIAKINNPASGTGVTASFQSADGDSATRDRFTLQSIIPGPEAITFVDINGNFLQAMRLLSGGTNQAITGGDVTTCGGCNGFDNNDLDRDLDDLNNNSNVQLDTDFVLTNPTQIMINDVAIPAFNPTSTTLNEVKALIDASAAGVTASYNTTTDQMTLTRNAPGSNPITFADLAGNFFQAMKFSSGGTPSKAVGGVVNSGGGNVTSTAVTLTTLNAQLAIPVSGDGSFFINGKLISYTMGQTLATVMTNITNDPDAGVTAEFAPSAPGLPGGYVDRLVLTRKAPGALDITFSENVGNFLRAMQFVSGSPSTWVGLDVADCANDGSGNQCDIEPINTNNASEVDDPLDQLNPDLTVDFLPVTNGSFLINGQPIPYNTATDSINSIIGKINDPLSGTGVTASFLTDNGNAATRDRLTLRAINPGTALITVEDVTGNFFRAMRFIAADVHASITGLDIGGDFNNDDLNDDLDEVGINWDVAPQIVPTQFSINSIAIGPFDPTTTTLEEVQQIINGSAADVTATYDTNADTLTLRRKTAGDLPITIADNSGNFFQAMRLLAPGTFESIRGLYVGDNFGNSDLTRPLRDLNSAEADFITDFSLSNNTQNFEINGEIINYCARSSNGSCANPTMAASTLSSIVSDINASAAGVTASIDVDNTDTMTLTRTVAGPNAISLVNGTGNFLQAMRFLTAPSHTTHVGENVADCGGCDIDNTQYTQDIDGINGELLVDITSTVNGSFTVNDTYIYYNSSSTTSDSISDILAQITSQTDVNASFQLDDGNSSTRDRVTLVHKTAGNQPISLVDVSGNFLRAMRLITQSGGSNSTVTGVDVGDLENGNLSADIDTLDDVASNLTVDFQLIPSSFTINSSGPINFDPNNDSLNDVFALINASPGADVTASFNTSDAVDRLTFTSDTFGAQSISFADVTGNFMAAMGMVSGGTHTSLTGADVGNLNDGGGSDNDLDDQLGDLTTELDVDFALTSANQLPATREFMINNVTIPYVAAASGGDTLDAIVARINASGAGVVATIDVNTDRMTLTRVAAGPQPAITVADLSGNFFEAMRFLSGGSRRTAVGDDIGGAVGDVTNANLNANMNTLTATSLKRLFQTGGDLTFSIRGVGFNYNASSDSILEILGEINASAAADVTATFDTSTDRLTVTRDTLNAPAFTAGDFADGTGNFLRVMGMVAAGDSFTTVVGGDVGGGFNEASDLSARLRLLNNGVSGNVADFDIPFDLTDSARQFTINSATITYCPRTSATGNGTCDSSAPNPADMYSTLNSVVASINHAPNGTGVTASIDIGTDRMTLTRNTAGPLDITFADIDGGNPDGNFLEAMQMFNATKTFGGLANSGATFSGAGGAASCVAPCTSTTGTAPSSICNVSPAQCVAGTDPTVTRAGAYTAGTAGGGFLLGVTVTPGATGGGSLPGVIVVVGSNGFGVHLGTEVAGGAATPPAPSDYDCTTDVPDVVTVPGNVLCGGAVTNLTTVTTPGTDPTPILVTPGVDQIIQPTLGLFVPPGGLTVGPPCSLGVQCPLATVTEGLDNTDMRGELDLGDVEAVGHIIATSTLSNHRPLDEPPVYFWEPFGPVQRAAGLFSRLAVFSNSIDYMGLVSYAGNAGLLPAGQTVRVPDLVLGNQFGAAGSAFEQRLLELEPDGSTNTGAGMCVALNDFQPAPAGHGRPGSDKIMVLLSDGAPTAAGQPGCPAIGSPAVPACAAYALNGNVPSGDYEYVKYMACLAKQAEVVIHTIGLGLENQTDEQLLMDVAAITGGTYFAAPTSIDLEQIFEDVANILGIALTR